MSFRFLTKFDPLVKNYQVLRNHYDILKTTVQTSKNVLFRLKNKQRWWHKSRLVGAEPEVYPQVDFCQHKSANWFWVRQQTAMKLLQMLLYNSTKTIIETKNKLQPRYGIIRILFVQMRSVMNKVDGQSKRSKCRDLDGPLRCLWTVYF